MLANRRNRIWLVFLLGVASTFAERAKAEVEPAKAEKPRNAHSRVPFTISKETTWITEPLRPDGTPDYAAALNARLSKGVTPENNAAVPLMQAFGAKIIEETHRKKFYKLLDVPLPGTVIGPFEDFYWFVEAELRSETNQREIEKKRKIYDDQQDTALERPWSRKQFPVVVKWIDENTETAILALEASKKPRFYVPIVVDDNEPLLNLLLPVPQNMRPLARMLVARSTLAIAEGRIEDAQNDLLACHRLGAKLVGQSTLIEALVGYAIDAMACQGDLVLAQSEKVTKQQLASFRRELSGLPAWARMSEIVDAGERLYSLDTICHIATGLDEKTAKAFGLPVIKPWQRIWPLSIHWDVILTGFNEIYDEVVEVLRIRNSARRFSELEKLTAALDKVQVEANTRKGGFSRFFGIETPHAVTSRQMGNVLVGLVFLNVELAAEAEVRAHTRRDLTIIALALAEYLLDNGSYPESLQDLSPKYLKTIPNDRFTDKPLRYQKQEAGYLLYSLGPNGKDDKGQTRGETQTSDDQVIRVPGKPEL